MSAAGVTDWSVACDYPGCSVHVWASGIGLYGSETPRELRGALRERGWTVDAPAPAMGRRLDFCPDHKPADEGGGSR